MLSIFSTMGESDIDTLTTIRIVTKLWQSCCDKRDISTVEWASKLMSAERSAVDAVMFLSQLFLYTQASADALSTLSAATCGIMMSSEM